MCAQSYGTKVDGRPSVRFLCADGGVVMNVMRQVRRFLMLSVASLICSCAHNPNATIGYYLPKSVVSVKVLRTIACNDLDEPAIQVGVIAATTYAADRNARQEFALAPLGSSFANTSSKFSFYPDGRLSGMNAAGKGAGKDIITAVLKVAAIAGGMGLAAQRPQPTFKTECDYIEASTKDDVITLVYEATIDLDNATVVVQADGSTRPLVSKAHLSALLADKQTYYPEDKALRDALTNQGVLVNPSIQLIPPALESANAHTKLSKMFGDICAFVLPQPDDQRPLAPVAASMEKSSFPLAMREPAITTLAVRSGRNCVEKKYWEGEIVDAKRGRIYYLAVPKAAAFGRTKFDLELQESGRVSSIAYEKDTGVGEVAGSIGEALSSFRPQTDAEKVAEINAESDLIAALERRALCLAHKSKCTK